MTNHINTDPILDAFQAGSIFAYPTEAVYGLGCDPDQELAVRALLALKKRPVSKGLILIAQNYSQLLPYVDDQAIPMDMRTEIFSSWPGPVTWLLPASKKTPVWISGGSDLIAVRVTGHNVVRDLCELFGKPLVSTSANLSGEEAAKNIQDVKRQFDSKVIVIEGELGGNTKPSKIRHGITGQTIRDN